MKIVYAQNGRVLRLYWLSRRQLVFGATFWKRESLNCFLSGMASKGGLSLGETHWFCCCTLRAWRLFSWATLLLFRTLWSYSNSYTRPYIPPTNSLKSFYTSLFLP